VISIIESTVLKFHMCSHNVLVVMFVIRTLNIVIDCIYLMSPACHHTEN